MTIQQRVPTYTQLSKCGQNGCKEEQFTAEEEKKVLIVIFCDRETSLDCRCLTKQKVLDTIDVAVFQFLLQLLLLLT